MLRARSTRARCSGLCLFRFEYCQGWILHSLSGQLALVVDLSSVSFLFKQNFLYFSLWPLPCFWDIAERNLSPHSLLPTIRYLYTLMRCPQRLFFYELNRPKSLILFLNKRYPRRWYYLIIFMVLNGHIPACPGSFEWQHNHPLYQPLFPFGIINTLGEGALCSIIPVH